MRRETKTCMFAAVLLPSLALGCGGPGERLFQVASYPSGATIYINGEPQGQTDVAKLKINFEMDQLVNLRLEKTGYQPTGTVLSNRSPEELSFFLEESPNNQKILGVLQDIRAVLDQISGQLQRDSE